MQELILIRHGQTDANQKLLYCGSTDLPLNAEGERLLQEIRKEGRLTETVFHEPADGRETAAGLPGSGEGVAFYTSGMRRTEQTLQILFGDVPHRILPDFREFDFGTYELKSYDMLKDDPGYQAWLSSPGDLAAPGGENSHAMKERVLRGLQLLQEGPDRKVVLVTHGGVILHIMRHFFPECRDPGNRYRFQPSGGHGFRISFDAAGCRYEAL